MPSIATTMDVILPVLETRLVTVTGLPPERINEWLGSEAPHFQGDHDLVLRLKGLQPESGFLEAGGRLSIEVTERLEIEVRTRLSLDPASSAKRWLTDPDFGHIPMRTLVVDALEGFLPTDGSGNGLTSCEIHLLPSGEPRSEGSSQKSPISWGSERLTFGIKYLHAVDLTRSITP